ncbi:MAG: hypothetical protein ACKVKG_12510 [Alphaproteobacteria bacterium]|jgi:predicted Zn-dependent protease
MPSVSTAFQRATYSFQRMSPAQASALKPRRLSVVATGERDNAARLSRRMDVDGFQQERFEVLNGLFGDAPLVPGRRVKLVVRKK